MAIWQILKSGAPTTSPTFDDGNPEQPGEDGFTTGRVVEHLASLGAAADGFNYVGPSPSAETA